VFEVENAACVGNLSTTHAAGHHSPGERHINIQLIDQIYLYYKSANFFLINGRKAVLIALKTTLTGN